MHLSIVQKVRVSRGWLVATLLLAFGGAQSLVACENDAYNDYPRGDPTPQAAALTDTHPGWQIPDCSMCHSDEHGPAVTVGHCGLCHGGNGGPQLTEAHPGWGSDGCAGCHSTLDLHATGLDDTGCGACHGDNGGAVDPPTNPVPQLTDAHYGWQNADCGVCHSLSGTHDGEFDAPTCGVCHGSNGGPLRPDNHWLTNCNDCHAAGPEPWNS